MKLEDGLTLPRVRAALAVAGWAVPALAALLVIAAFVGRNDEMFVIGLAAGAIGVVFQLAYRTIAPPPPSGTSNVETRENGR
jgi:hypothetical protein